MAESVNPEDALDIVGRVPRHVEYHHSVGRNQVDAQTSRACGYEEQSEITKNIVRFIKFQDGDINQ